MGFSLKKLVGGAVAGIPGVVGANVLEKKQQKSQIERDRREKEYRKQLKAIGPTDYQTILAGVPEFQKADFSKQIAARTIGSPESEAARSQMVGGLQSQEAMQRRQLLAAQARSGVRGGAAAGQTMRQEQVLGQQRAGQEQGLFLKQLQELQDLERQQQFANLAADLARRQIAESIAGSRLAAQSTLTSAYLAGQ